MKSFLSHSQISWLSINILDNNRFFMFFNGKRGENVYFSTPNTMTWLYLDYHRVFYHKSSLHNKNRLYFTILTKWPLFAVIHKIASYISRYTWKNWPCMHLIQFTCTQFHWHQMAYVCDYPKGAQINLVITVCLPFVCHSVCLSLCMYVCRHFTFFTFFQSHRDEFNKFSTNILQREFHVCLYEESRLF